MKWIKRIFIGTGIVVLMLAVLAGVAIHRMHTVPAWYGAPRCTPAQWQEAGRHAKQVFGQTFSWSADMLAKTVRSRTEGWDAANTAKTITLSQDEINAWYDIHDNTDTAALVERVNPFLRDLRITFIDGAIVISGKPKDSDTVDSLVLKPHVDEQGNLDLRLTDVLVGTLSVPRVFMGKTFAQLQSDLTAHVAAQQSRAGIDAYGAVNRAAMTAAYAQMLLNCLAGQPSEAIFFVPFDFKDSSKALAVRLAAITADDGKMTFTLRALTPEERLALTQKINHAAAPATVGPATP